MEASDSGAMPGDSSMMMSMPGADGTMSGADGAMPGADGYPGGLNPAMMDPAHLRYVDMTYTPLPADRLRGALTTATPEDAFLVVAKRIPVRMGVVMDQRQVHRFIAECGNSNLIVEVRQVRVNRPKAASSMGMGAMGDMMSGAYGSMGGEMMSMMPGMGDAGGYGSEMSSDGMSSEMGYGAEGDPSMTMSSPYGMSGGAAAGSDRSPYDLPVEIYGMVYIYNPVNMEKLGIEPALAGATPETPAATAPDAAPAAPPAAPSGTATTGTDNNAATVAAAAGN